MLGGLYELSGAEKTISVWLELLCWAPDSLLVSANSSLAEDR